MDRPRTRRTLQRSPDYHLSPFREWRSSWHQARRANSFPQAACRKVGVRKRREVMINNHERPVTINARLLVEAIQFLPSDLPIDDALPPNNSECQLICVNARARGETITPAVICLPEPIIAGLLPAPNSYQRGTQNVAVTPRVIILPPPAMNEVGLLPAPQDIAENRLNGDTRGAHSSGRYARCPGSNHRGT